MSAARSADVAGAHIVALHDARLGGEPQPPRHPARALAWIERNHASNRLLWHEEDLARRTGVADAEIVANKRAIDRCNQQRNDAIEAIDEALLARLADITPACDAWQNSETAGSMIDRLSILALKIRHMGIEAQRGDANAAHRAQCAERHARLELQRHDLARCYDELLARAIDGKVFWRVYRQFKMYNDPALNPYLRQPPG
jgi:hypothetical protein